MAGALQYLRCIGGRQVEAAEALAASVGGLHEAEGALVERYLEAAGKGKAVADAGVEAGHGAFAELRTRRLGLAASLIVILAVIVGLVLKIRQMERPGE